MQIGRTPMMHVPARRRQPEVAYVIPPEPMIAFPHIARERSMHETKRPGLVFAISVAAVAVFGAIGNATEAYPTRPITMVVPYPAAGLFDALARDLAEPMRKALGQSVVIENVGGANGSIAAGRVARAAPDGYTIGIGSGDQFVVNAAIYPLQYDVVKDFEPIALVMNGPLLIVARNAVPANNLKELIAWLKANHATVAFGHNGSGGVLHCVGSHCSASRCELAIHTLSGRRAGAAGHDRRTA